MASGPLPRWQAALEAVIVCGVPTQLVITLALLSITHLRMLNPQGQLELGFFATLSLVDTAVVATLITVFLHMSGERPADVFVGTKPIRGEVLRGLVLVPVVFLAVTGVVLGLRTLAPWMHTVDQNPLETFMRTPLDAGVFLVVVVLAGGVREELQRAFILHRFDQRLGGIKLGLVLFSLTFGALHLEQGADVAVAIGLLGLLWGIIYAQRRSALLPMVNHGAFNAVQVLQGILVKSLGG
jgi:membrane protease YdiL (CAAX protease family)